MYTGWERSWIDGITERIFKMEFSTTVDKVEGVVSFAPTAIVSSPDKPGSTSEKLVGVVCSMTAFQTEFGGGILQLLLDVIALQE